MDREVKQRLTWVKLYEQTSNAGLVCRRCGISRPTLRKGWWRYQAEGEAGLKSRSFAHGIVHSAKLPPNTKAGCCNCARNVCSARAASNTSCSDSMGDTCPLPPCTRSSSGMACPRYNVRAATGTPSAMNGRCPVNACRWTPSKSLTGNISTRPSTIAHVTRLRGYLPAAQPQTH